MRAGVTVISDGVIALPKRGHPRLRPAMDQPAGAFTDLADAPCEPLDEQIITLLLIRRLRAREHHAARLAAGLPARPLAAEYAMARQYASRLGRHGAQVAQAILALTHADAPPDARRPVSGWRP